jgi:hypothetical protein
VGVGDAAAWGKMLLYGEVSFSRAPIPNSPRQNFLVNALLAGHRAKTGLCRLLRTLLVNFPYGFFFSEWMSFFDNQYHNYIPNNKSKNVSMVGLVWYVGKSCTSARKIKAVRPDTRPPALDTQTPLTMWD